MIFRQLLDPETSTYSYLLADEDSAEAVLIDPVREQFERDRQLISELGLRLLYALETHVHADHVTGGGLLREALGCRLALGEHTGVLTADLRLADGDVLSFGKHNLAVRSTPGHTDGCVSYVLLGKAMAFTGDALLIRGCGRTDFQQGDARRLYASVRQKILSLPDDTLLYPGHDYKGRTVTTVGEEKRHNPRLGEHVPEPEFLRIMNELRLAPPARIDEAVPANMASGLTSSEPSTPSSDPRDAWAPIARTAGGIPVVAPAWLQSNREQVQLLDVREHVEFCGPLGHLEGAQLVPLSELLTRQDTLDPQQPVVAICAYGTRSRKAVQILAEKGFTRVASLEGGLQRWWEEGRPVVGVMGDRVRQDAEIWQGMGI